MPPTSLNGPKVSKAEATVRANDRGAFLLDSFCDFLCIAVTLCAICVEKRSFLPGGKIVLYKRHHTLFKQGVVDTRSENNEIVGRKISGAGLGDIKELKKRDDDLSKVGVTMLGNVDGKSMVEQINSQFLEFVLDAYRSLKWVRS